MASPPPENAATVPCQNYVLEVTNRSSLKEDPGRPEVLISGALHGDERIGPVTAMALSQWLIERYDYRVNFQAMSWGFVGATLVWGALLRRAPEPGAG